jgi:hypothetical protein
MGIRPLRRSIAVALASAASLAAGAAAAGSDARTELVSAFARSKSAYPYRRTETSTSSFSQVPTVRVDEVAGPREVHSSWSAGTHRGERIEIRGRTWWKQNGKWIEEPPDSDPSGNGIDVAELVASALTGVERAGSERLDGAATTVYSFRFRLDDADGIGRAWIGADGLPRRAEAKIQVEGVTMASKLDYEYGVPVRVEAPGG